MSLHSPIEGDGKFPLDPSNIQNIDLAMYTWLNEVMNIYCNSNRGWQKTPVIWTGGERTFQIKNNRDLRDKNGSFILPFISVERTGMTKDLKKKGSFYANIPPINDERGASINIVKEINQEKTSNFANADAKRRTGQETYKLDDNKKIVYITKSIPLPIYIAVTYLIELRSEYQQQMNEMVQPLMTFSGGVNYFIIENEGHRYEAFMKSDYSSENNISKLGDEARMFHTKITIEVLGHLVGKGVNQDQPKVVIRENIVEIKIGKERTWTDDELKLKKFF